MGPVTAVTSVTGPSGSGKSRLLAEVAVRCDVPFVSVRAFLPEEQEAWALGRSLLREALTLDLQAAHLVPDRAAQALANVLPERALELSFAAVQLVFAFGLARRALRGS